MLVGQGVEGDRGGVFEKTELRATGTGGGWVCRANAEDCRTLESNAIQREPFDNSVVFAGVV